MTVEAVSGGNFTVNSADGSLTFTCGLRDDAAVVCWGYNGDGQTDVPAGAVSASSSGSNRA
ncbi:MAG: RCC1 domain-containing protein [bacterium]|nr:RCC1 domain-containing protein [bacterium]